MPSKNAVSLIGYLGKDPEFSDNNSVQSARLTLATSEKWKDKNSGEWKEKTEWHNISIFGNQAVYASKYLSKGSLVAIEGSLKTDKYTDKNGIERYATKILAREIQGLDKNPASTQKSEPAPQNQQYNASDDDIPF